MLQQAQIASIARVRTLSESVGDGHKMLGELECVVARIRNALGAYQDQSPVSAGSVAPSSGLRKDADDLVVRLNQLMGSLSVIEDQICPTQTLGVVSPNASLAAGSWA